MALTLTSDQVSSFAALQQALLSPLEYEGVEAWCVAIIRLAEQLCEADRSAVFVPCSEQHYYVSESIDPALLRSYEKRIERFEPGAVRYRDRDVDYVMATRRAMGLEVWSVQGLARAAGVELEKQPVYHEHIKPSGIAHGRVMTIELPKGEAFLGISHSDPRDDPFKGDEGYELLSLLHPAFKSGVGAVTRHEGRRDQLEQALDDLAETVAIVTDRGTEVHRSHRLRNLLDADPQRHLLEEHIKWIAVEVGAIRSGGSNCAIRPRGHREVETPTARYALRASLLDRGVLGLHHAVLVSVECLTPQLPSPQSLQGRHGLTPREAEVALLLAEGLSNADIAESLGISHHTVRHHAERIFGKLGIDSRKAIGLHLLGWPRQGA